MQLFLFNDVHIELWQKLREGRVIGLLNAKALPHREGSKDTAITIDYSGKLLEVGDAQDFAICQGRTRVRSTLFESLAKWRESPLPEIINRPSA